MSMASRDRVLSALNFITGEGVNYYCDGVDGNDVEALISDYFDAPTDDEDNHMKAKMSATTVLKVILDLLPKHAY